MDHFLFEFLKLSENFRIIKKKKKAEVQLKLGFDFVTAVNWALTL
jgi:hypothetical protein